MISTAQDPVERAETRLHQFRRSSHLAFAAGILCGIVFPSLGYGIGPTECFGGAAFAGCLIFEILAGRCDRKISRLREDREEEKEREYQAEIKRLKSKAEHLSQIAVQSAIQQEPRHISENARLFIKERISRFAGQRFRVEVGVENIEGQAFAKEVVSVLQECGWVGEIWPGLRIEMSPGMDFYYKPESNAKTKEAAPNVWQAFSLGGYVQAGASYRPDANVDYLPNDTIAFMIGTKPTMATNGLSAKAVISGSSTSMSF
jgi:hypothetical protein